jgi:hypothetical protein
MQFCDAIKRRNSAAKKFARRVAPIMRDLDKAEAKYREFKKAEWPAR